MALPKIDFDQNDHDHFDHDTGALSIAIRANKIEKKSPKDSSTAMKSSYFCSVE